MVAGFSIKVKYPLIEKDFTSYIHHISTNVHVIIYDNLCY